MYTWKIADGDLAVRGDGNIVDVSGVDRIRQELACWILEPLGTDVLNGGFGSTLGNYIGSPALEDILIDIRAEVNRVVLNYIAHQKKQIEAARSSMTTDIFTNSWKPEDVIQTVNGIDVSALADTVSVTVKLTTASGAGITVEQTL